MTKPLFGKPIEDRCCCGAAVSEGEAPQKLEMKPDGSGWFRWCAKCLRGKK